MLRETCQNFAKAFDLANENLPNLVQDFRLASFSVRPSLLSCFSYPINHLLPAQEVINAPG